MKSDMNIFTTHLSKQPSFLTFAVADIGKEILRDWKIMPTTSATATTQVKFKYTIYSKIPLKK